MKIFEIAMRNFMPYKGEHKISLPTDPSQNVTVVFGDNMRGKTSLLNAFRWGLYGKALGRHLSVIDLTKLINRDAAASGDWTLAVHLRFQWSGDEYELRRVARPRPLVRQPRNAGDFDVEVSLRRNGTVLPGDRIDHTLNQIAPEQVSRFFLFDGELLQEYETLLSDDSRQGEEIKSAIEQVLGVPALLEGREQIATLRKKAQTQQAKESRHIKSIRGLAEEQLELQKKIDARLADIEALEKQRNETQSKIDQLDEYLASTEVYQRVKVQIEGLKEKLGDLERREESVDTEKLSVLREAWRDLIQPRLQARMETLRSRVAKHHKAIETSGALKRDAERIREALDSGACETCGRELEPGRREELGRQLARIELELEASRPDTEQFQTIAEELNRLSRISATGATGRLKELEDETSRVALDLTSTETKILELNEQIEGQDTAEISRRRETRDLLQRNLGKLERDLERVRGEIEKDQARQNEISRLISNEPESRHRRSTRQVEVYAELEKVFDEAVGELRDRLRGSVEELASETFLRLTTETGYKGLTINENYGLSIVDEHDRVVTVRSAGAEQIVALSLIDGLNRTARKSGPIIMDTPLGRLDLKHRASVLAEVPRMAEQVVLLVHEGEIDRETGLEPLASRIGRMYEIQRVSSARSRISDVRQEQST